MVPMAKIFSKYQNKGQYFNAFIPEKNKQKMITVVIQSMFNPTQFRQHRRKHPMLHACIDRHQNRPHFIDVALKDFTGPSLLQRRGN
jgi:hypothetical protein